MIKNDAFAFFNQQLAVMLRQGVPLEGALRHLARDLREEPLRTEVQFLESDLSKGNPLKEALARRNLPELYKRMVELGVRSNDLPGVLTLVADHYHRVNVTWTRLKGLMVYPLLVLAVALVLSVLLSSVLAKFLAVFDSSANLGFSSPPPMPAFAVWLPPAFVIVLVVAVTAGLLVPSWRGRLRWSVPGFRDASLAQVASVMSLMLRRGASLSEALALARGLEARTPAAAALARWQKAVEEGRGKPAEWPAENRPFPPLFGWLLQQGGEDPAGGFQKAAEVYQARAGYRVELALYGALPLSILLLAQMLIWQVMPLFRNLVWFMNMLGDMGM